MGSLKKERLKFIESRVTIKDPPISAYLFTSSDSAWIWLVVRVWLGWYWIDASFDKIANPDWIQTGEAVKNFWMQAVGTPLDVSTQIEFGWYHSFIEYLLNAGLQQEFGILIAYGELLVGLALVTGAFVGIAAFFGAVMNWNYIMLGVASANGMLFILAIFLMMAWKVAGYYGFDYFLLKFFGVPWELDDPDS